MNRLRTVARPNTRRFEELRAIAQTMRDRRGGAVVWFDLVDRSDMIVTETMAVNRLPVRLTRELSDGRVYLFDAARPATGPATTAPAPSAPAPPTAPARERRGQAGNERRTRGRSARTGLSKMRKVGTGSTGHALAPHS